MPIAEELVQRLRDSGRRLTPQRLLIISLLDGNEQHPTAEALHAQALGAMPTLSLKTVYSVLHELTEVGGVLALDLGTGATRFDPTTGAHHHLVCTACGKVRDVHLDVPGLAPPDDQRQGFDVDAAEVVFRGTCATCSAPKTTTTPTQEGPTHA